MTSTTNFNIPKPDVNANVDDEFYRLIQAWDIVDSLFFTMASNIAGKAAAIHRHAIADVDGLTQELANKMSAAARFSLDDLTNVSGTVDSALGYVLAKTAAGWQPISPAAAIGAHQHVTADIIDFNQKVDAKISALVGGAPGVLDTLSEIATAMGNDPNLRTTLINMISGKLATTGGTLTGALTIAMQSPVINMVATQNGVNRRIFHDGTNIGFLDSSGNWIIRGDDSGAIWTKQLGDLNSRIEARATAFAVAYTNNCVQNSQAGGYAEVGVKTGSGGAGDFNYSGYYVCRIYKSGVENIQVGGRQPQLYIPNRGWFAAFPF